MEILEELGLFQRRLGALVLYGFGRECLLGSLVGLAKLEAIHGTDDRPDQRQGRDTTDRQQGRDRRPAASPAPGTFPAGRWPGPNWLPIQPAVQILGQVL